MAGKRLSSIEVRRKDLRLPVPDDLSGKAGKSKILRLERRGKYILIFLDNGQTVVLHLGMSGRITIVPPGHNHRVSKHDHIIFRIEDASHIIFNDPRRFGMVYLVPAGTWEKQPPFAAMGPEPLGNHFSGPVLAERLAGRRGPVKTALLDQHVVAGVGNIYACEALYMSGIHPETSAGALDATQAEALAGAIRAVLARAIEAGGSTLKDYRHTDGNLGYFQTQFSVYDREGLSCPDKKCGCVCKGGIRRIVQSGRSTFFCPVRQAKPRAKARNKTRKKA